MMFGENPVCHPARLAIECLSPAPRSNGDDDDYDGIICTNKCPFGRSVRSSVRLSVRRRRPGGQQTGETANTTTTVHQYH